MVLKKVNEIRANCKQISAIMLTSTSRAIISTSKPNNDPRLGVVRPKSPCTNSFMYVPA